MACGERGAIRLSNCQPALFLGAALPSGVRREGHSGGAPLREAKDAGHLVMPGISNLTEQSENVIENKGSAQISTTPNPSLSKEGNFGLASSDGEGWPECRPEGRRYENCRNKARMSMKTKDRYGKVACRWLAGMAGRVPRFQATSGSGSPLGANGLAES